MAIQNVPEILNVLPNETLLYLLEYLDHDDLYCLALLSRRLNHLALPVYFSRHGLRDPWDLSKLALSGESLNALPGLRISISVSKTTLNRFTCEFSSRDGLARRAVLEVTRLLALFASVGSVTLNLPATTRRDEVSELALLQLIKRKSCSKLQIVGTPGLPEPFPASYGKKTLQRYNHDTASGFKKIVKSIPYRNRSRDCSLESLVLYSTTPFRPTFYQWTMKVLTSQSLTHLTFNMGPFDVPPGTWSYSLPWVTLPSLLSFTIKGSTITLPDIYKFLQRHPTITHLTILHIGFTDGVVPPFTAAFLPHLISLTVTPEYASRFLSGDGMFPSLNYLGITVYAWGVFDFGRLQDALQSLGAPRTKGLTLALALPNLLASARWLNSELETPNRSTIKQLCSVVTLSLTVDWISLDPDALTALPTWIALFPSLRRVELKELTYGVRIDSLTKAALVQSITEACPDIDSTEFLNDTSR